MAEKFSISLIVSTYNRPDYLEMTLRSALAQTELPDEIIVADDGSTDETRSLVEKMAAEAPIPLVHVWHEDKGFRLGAIRNKAISRAKGDYILQVDGDIFLHPRFVADHRRFARRGEFVTGSRVILDSEATAEVIRTNRLPSYFAKGLRSKGNLLRMPLLTPLFRKLRRADGTYVRGCHMAFWRDDLLRVNGYNEDISGWGREDSEISWRLMNAGLKKAFLKFGAVECHLYHPEQPRDMDQANLALMRRARDERIVRTPHGIVSDDNDQQ